MQRRIREHFRSNIVSYVALFLFAIGGSAYAVDGPLPGQNQVGSADIIDGEAKNNDIGADSVASGNVLDRQVKNADLSLGASSSNTIADGGIQGIDVKNDTLTGTQIDESTLAGIPPGGVPASGPAGGDLQGSYPNPQVKPATVSGPARLDTLGPGFPCSMRPDQWLEVSPDVNNEAGFTRDRLGIVHLRGVVNTCGTPASGDTIFTLPVGSRPQHLEHFGTVAADAFGAVTVDPSGDVTAVAGNFRRETAGWISLDRLTFRCWPPATDGCP